MNTLGRSQAHRPMSIMKKALTYLKWLIQLELSERLIRKERRRSKK
nr:MAG TPA: hypothetical protein [Caudoviricetes sp.]